MFNSSIKFKIQIIWIQLCSIIEKKKNYLEEILKQERFPDIYRFTIRSLIR